MRSTLACLFVACSAVLFARPACAEEVMYVDGNVQEASVVEVREDAIRITFSPAGGGTATIDVAASRLDPSYFYGLRDKAAGQDAKARIRLALWAVEQGLFTQAKAQVRKAAAIDPALVKSIEDGKLSEIREGIANRILASAQADLQGGRLDLAEDKVELLLARLPDTEAGGKARELQKTVAERQEEEEAKSEAKKEAEQQAKLAEDEKKAAAERKKLLDGVWKGLKQGKKWKDEGLAEDSESKALDLLEKALLRGKQGLDELAEIEKSHASDATLVAEIKTWRKKVVAAMVRVHFRRADIYVWRESLNQARDEVKAASALDPENPEIQAMLQRIASAQSDGDWGLAWRRRAGGEGGRFGGGGRGGGGRGGRR